MRMLPKIHDSGDDNAQGLCLVENPVWKVTDEQAAINSFVNWADLREIGVIKSTTHPIGAGRLRLDAVEIPRTGQRCFEYRILPAKAG
jgi:hypothetical protein